MTTPATPAYASAAPLENVVRGALFALIVIPVGAAAWVALWSIGFIASIVSFGVAAAAVWLYRKGSGGTVGGAGVLVIAAVVLVTLLVGFWLGLVVDYARFISEQYGLGLLEVFGSSAFWPSFSLDFGALLSANGFNLLLSLLFGALGAFGVLRSVFKAAKASDAAASPYAGLVTPPPAPAAPPVAPQLNPGTTGTLNQPSGEPPTKP